MREILFKAKCTDTREWVEGYPVKYGPVYWMYIGKVDISIPYTNEFKTTIYPPIKYVISPKTLCQYTGLTDKNGKRIFEGDIIKASKFGVDDGKGHNFAGYDLFSVKWDNGGFVLFNRWRRFNLRDSKKDYEVVGNIFDNPKLLEVAE